MSIVAKLFYFNFENITKYFLLTCFVQQFFFYIRLFDQVKFEHPQVQLKIITASKYKYMITLTFLVKLKDTNHTTKF